MPTIEDSPFVLWESNTIVRYLTAKHSTGKLWPEDHKVRAEADKWMDWQNSMFLAGLPAAVLEPLVRAPADEARRATRWRESRLKTAEILGYLDTHLKNRMYIVGEHLTMGDIPMGCAVWRWMSLPVERPVMANLQRWFGTLRERPAYQHTVMPPVS